MMKLKNVAVGVATLLSLTACGTAASDPAPSSVATAPVASEDPMIAQCKSLLQSQLRDPSTAQWLDVERFDASNYTEAKQLYDSSGFEYVSYTFEVIATNGFGGPDRHVYNCVKLSRAGYGRSAGSLSIS